MKVKAVILAAGQGTRMRSALPKVLHPLAGRPLVWHALTAAREATNEKPVLVIGHGAGSVRQTIGNEADYVVQERQLGTGHAVQQAETLLRGKWETIMVTSADMPLLTSTTLRQLIRAHRTHDGPITMLSVVAENARGFGRILRDSSDQVMAIVEEADASPEQLAIRELNAGAYCFTAAWLWDALNHIPLSPKGEYYLTDLVGYAISEGLSVQAILAENPAEAIGVNTRAHLAEAGAALRNRINLAWMLKGVTIIDPATTYIEVDASIGPDTVIWPNTHLRGDTTIGRECCIGPNTLLKDSTVGNQCEIIASIVEESVLADGTIVPPYSHLCHSNQKKIRAAFLQTSPQKEG